MFIVTDAEDPTDAVSVKRSRSFRIVSDEGEAKRVAKDLSRLNKREFHVVKRGK